MEAVLSRRVHDLVANGWEPVTTTETTASLVGRRPFAWWLIQLQESEREACVERQRQIKERGFLRVMWPQLLVSLALLALWFYLLKTYI